MKQEIAQIWVDDLRDPRNMQTQRHLSNVDRTKHCCLGRLCELAILNEVPVFTTTRRQWGEDEMTFDGHIGRLPWAVRNWAGIDSESPGLDIEGRWITLIELNDTGWTFDQLATVIAKRWEDL